MKINTETWVRRYRGCSFRNKHRENYVCVHVSLFECNKMLQYQIITHFFRNVAKFKCLPTTV